MDMILRTADIGQEIDHRQLKMIRVMTKYMRLIAKFANVAHNQQNTKLNLIVSNVSLINSIW